MPKTTRERLVAAAAIGRTADVRVLLAAESPPSEDDVAEALDAAAWGGSAGIVQLILQHGVAAEACSRALLAAARHCRGDAPLVVAALLAAGADANTSDYGHYGRTPLHLAAGCQETPANAVAVVGRLLDAGAHIAARDAKGSTALHAAAQQGHADVIARLIEAGSDVEAENAAGERAIHLAARSRDEAAEKLRLLLDAGASPVAPTRSGETPLKLALFAAHEALEGGDGLNPAPPLVLLEATGAAALAELLDDTLRAGLAWLLTKGAEWRDAEVVACLLSPAVPAAAFSIDVLVDALVEAEAADQINASVDHVCRPLVMRLLEQDLPRLRAELDDDDGRLANGLWLPGTTLRGVLAALTDETAAGRQLAEVERARAELAKERAELAAERRALQELAVGAAGAMKRLREARQAGAGAGAAAAAEPAAKVRRSKRQRARR